MRVKILRLLCGLGLVLRLGSVQFDLLVVIVWLCYVSPSGEWNRRSGTVACTSESMARIHILIWMSPQLVCGKKIACRIFRSKVISFESYFTNTHTHTHTYTHTQYNTADRSHCPNHWSGRWRLLCILHRYTIHAWRVPYLLDKITLGSQASGLTFGHDTLVRNSYIRRVWFKIIRRAARILRVRWRRIVIDRLQSARLLSPTASPLSTRETTTTAHEGRRVFTTSGWRSAQSARLPTALIIARTPSDIRQFIP